MHRLCLDRVRPGAGGHIILACRDMEKCEAAARDIRGETLNHHVSARHLDLASLKSIREFAAKVIEGRWGMLASRAEVWVATLGPAEEPEPGRSWSRLPRGARHCPACGGR